MLVLVLCVCLSIEVLTLVFDMLTSEIDVRLKVRLFTLMIADVQLYYNPNPTYVDSLYDKVCSNLSYNKSQQVEIVDYTNGSTSDFICVRK